MPSTAAPSPSRNRVTTARAASSCPPAAWLAPGLGPWSIDAPGVAADDAPGAPLGLGAPSGPSVHAGGVAAGVHATATVAATTPPPASTAPRRKPRRLRLGSAVGDRGVAASVVMGGWW